MEPSGLEAHLRDEIRRRGPIPFADFMRVALYHDPHGYYRRDAPRIGPDGDFYTAPTTHPAFGALLALQLERCWDLLERPATFTVVEGGGGKGRLAEDILSYARDLTPAFAGALDYRIMELGHTGRASCQPNADTLSITWEDGAGLPAIEDGVFLSNELFDAYPRHRVVQQGGALHELLVDAHAGGFVEVLAEPTRPALAERLRTVNVELPEGCRAEIDLEGPAFLADAGRTIRRGFMITIDYGYPAETLYSAARREGTLLCYHRHTSSTNPYIRLGRQDITAHVDFTALAFAGEEAGLVTEGLLTQQRYLKKLGVQAFIDALRSVSADPRQQMANRMALLELTRANGFGGFGVLVQSTGNGGEPWGIDEIVISRARGGLGDLPPVLLTPGHMPLLDGKYPHYQQLDELWPASP